MCLELKKVRVLFGAEDLLTNNVEEVFSEKSINMLDTLSKTLLKDPLSRKYADIITFSYWCRRNNLCNLKKQFEDHRSRLGVGLLFHITPSNVPINFAFSMAFGIITGNSNVIRVPTKKFDQIDILIRAIEKSSQVCEDFYKRVLIVNYEKDDDITIYFLKKCKGKIIWGGDETVSHIKKLSSTFFSNTFDVFFPNKYSICTLNADVLINEGESNLERLVEKFYNDTFLFDQNACSSPHIVFWYGTPENIEESKKIFWNSLFLLVRKNYDLKPIMSIDKYEKICQDFQRDCVVDAMFFENYIYCVNLSKIDVPVDELCGKFGYFYEYSLSNMDELFLYSNNRCQTLTYYGFNKSFFEGLVQKNKPSGIDRIVPVGEALSIGMIWDGKDIVRSLSRICDIN